MLISPHDLVPAGTVVILAEDDHRYGLGPLRLRVEQITPLRSEPGWALITGARIGDNGQTQTPFELVVRIHALLRHQCSPASQPSDTRDRDNRPPQSA